MRELINSEKFKKYQLRLAKKMSDSIWEIQQKDPHAAIGAIGLAKKVMKFPKSIDDSDLTKRTHKEVMERFQRAFLDD